MEIPVEIVIWGLGVSFTMLSVIIGFMFKMLQDLVEAINKISLYIAKDEERNAFETKDCDVRHSYISSKLHQHSEKLEDHEKRILKIEK